MKTDKEIKKEFKLKASKEPDKYYATSVLKKEGFARKKCSKCGTFFWTVTEDNVCGDPACSGGFRFINNSPAKNKLDYIGVWEKFSDLFSKWGYIPIKRYPVTARWRNDTDFVQASIYDFQPYVVSGEVEPPANPPIVPQPCLRFNDIDNIGITGAHYSCFVMIGQLAFMKPKDFEQEKYFTDIHNWLKEGLGLKNDEIKFHEDVWVGGGNFGPCMEFFSRGLELGNQVYMLYEVTSDGYKELNLKVLDMGMGQERNSWFTQGKSTSYETTFPTVVEKFKKMTGIKIDPELMRKFLPYSSYLNVDEVEDIDKTWNLVAKKIGYDVEELKKKISETSALYSIAEHSRALLVALSDGALPSNVGGGYNLRVLFRRAISLMDKYNWNIEVTDLCKLHAQYLKPLFPELLENLDEVNEILNVEKKKYNLTKEKANKIISNIKNEKVDDKKLLMFYDSYGIAPELVKGELEKYGERIDIPDNFYAKVAELHEKKAQEATTEREEKLDLEGLPETKALYYDDYLKNENMANVLQLIENKVILDKTVAYPTSGGQLHDIGTINGEEIIDVFKQGNIIIHVLKNKPKFKVNDIVTVKIDPERRKQLAQHHTATHIVGAAARKILGRHINQASAKKTKEKATLDITHYESLSDDKIKEIENEANKIVNSKVAIIKNFYPRTEAEKLFGMNIYQGGAVPGKNLRIVQIKGLDTQACGGTHLDNTSETGEIKILKSTKISDSVVRIEFTAGKAAEKEKKEKEEILKEAAKVLNVEIDELPARVEELFNKWKKVKKAAKKGIKLEKEDFELTNKEKFSEDVLAETAKILQTQSEHVVKTIRRFLNELEEIKKK